MKRVLFEFWARNLGSKFSTNSHNQQRTPLHRPGLYGHNCDLYEHYTTVGYATDHSWIATEMSTQPTENVVPLGLPDHFLRTSIQQPEDTTDQVTYS